MTTLAFTVHAPRDAQQAAAERAFAFGGPSVAHAETRIPLRLARCCPSEHCAQVDRCAHADARLCDRREPIVDGMSLRHSGGNWCPIFIDARGVHPHENPQEAA